MKPYLLDVNVLIALGWPSHVHHGEAQQWFAKKRSAGFRTCPLTQIGFVRISSNAAFTPDAVSPKTALALLEQVTALPEHGFWADDIALNEAIQRDEPILGHRQITDDYLLALAKSNGGTVATLDGGMLATAATGDLVELIQGNDNTIT